MEADVPGGVEVVEPGQAALHLRIGDVEVEGGERGGPERDLDDAERERERAGGDAREREQPDHERPQQREQDEHVGQPAVRAHDTTCVPG